MLQYSAVDAPTLELLKHLMEVPTFSGLRLVGGTALADSKDIAAMKLAAITGRGTKKDFIDLYFLLKQYSLSEIVSFYKNKYADGSVFLVMKSLTYFDDADREQPPVMLKQISWTKAKKAITSAVKQFFI